MLVTVTKIAQMTALLPYSPLHTLLFCTVSITHTTKLMTNSSTNEMCQRLKSRKVLMGYLHLRVVARLRPMRPTPAYNSTTELPIFTAFWSLRKSTSKTCRLACPKLAGVKEMSTPLIRSHNSDSPRICRHLPPKMICAS
jgi:hypothetical protein